jgi:hypothetical protein
MESGLRCCRFCVLLLVIVAIVSVSGCTQGPGPGPGINGGDENTSLEADVVYKIDDTPRPSWMPLDPNMQNPPENGKIYLAKSEDGLTFTDEKMFVHRAGVPDILLTSDNRLIAVFQYFSFQYQELSGKIAYTVSDDFGETWSSVKRVLIQGLQTGGAVPVDPTLVELEDGSLRLYFTYHPPGQQYPGPHSAFSDSIDGTFVSEGLQLETDERILDPAVVYFNGMWHHYTIKQVMGAGGSSEGVHSVSEDGLNFVRQDNIDLDFNFLGGAIEDNGKLRFYSGMRSAISEDGYTWTIEEGQRVNGADPGITRLPDGSYIIVYVRHWE